MKLFLAPHNDDETLFGAFTIIRERPHVLAVYDSIAQQQRGLPISANARRYESTMAMARLGSKVDFCGLRDDNCDGWAATGLVDGALDSWQAINGKPEHIWAPAIEIGGHEQHNLVGRIADELWPGRVTHYLTYKRGQGKSRSANEVPYEPEWILRKLKALACYESQIVNKEAGCWPWFAEDLREYYE